MKYIKQNLNHCNFDEIEIVALGDLHIGDNACDVKLLKSYIDYINSKDNVYVIGIGDYLNNALKLSKTDVYNAVAPQKELEMAVEILSKIPTSRWLAMTTGNHEIRTAKEAGIDINEFLAYRLGIEDIYHKGMCIIDLKFDSFTYWIMIHHGAGGGATKGGAMNKMQRLSDIIPNADLVLMGHTHQSMLAWDSCYFIDKKHYKMKKHNQLLVNTGSMLGYRDGYAEGMMLKPSRKGNAIVTLESPKNKRSNFKAMKARWNV